MAEQKVISLDDKVSLSKERLKSILENLGVGRVGVAWTGGKDSTTVLHLWREVIEEHHGHGPDDLRAINLDTGFKFPEILAFRDKLAAAWGVNVHVFRSDQVSSDVFGSHSKVDCCRILKIEPLKHAIRTLGLAALLSGVRADEHEVRADRTWREERIDPDYLLVHPLLHWSEMDVWAYHMSRGLPYCSLYDHGYRSLGCHPCTTLPQAGGDERSGRCAEKEDQMKVLQSLGYF